MKKKLNTKGTLEALLVIGLILIIPLFFVIRTAAEQNAAPNTPVPVVPTSVNAPALPTTANAPEDSNAMKPKQPPACTFPLAQTTTAETTPEEYTFSEPQVVLTAPQGNPLNVAQWLPDNQQVLVTEELRNQYKESNDTTTQQSISLYNLETDTSRLYAVRTTTDEVPVWQPELNGVVYSALNYTSLDKKNGIYKFTRQLMVSYGDKKNVQLLADNLSQVSFAAKSDDSEIMYLSGKQISKLDKALKKSFSISFDPTQWDYAKSRRNNRMASYQSVWQPGTSLVFLYSQGGGMLEGGYTFILDTATGSVCELNLGGWAFKAHWSSDGRYLAIARPSSYTGLSDSIDLVVLDSATGDLRTVEAVLQDSVGRHYIEDFTWTPDNLHLLILENIPSTYDPYHPEEYHHELYLVDLASDQSTHLFPAFKSFFADGMLGSNNFVWSPDNLKLLVRCPLMGRSTDRFCLVNVQSAK